MTLKIKSRTDIIDNEQCIRQLDSGRYDLVLIAAQRLRELKRQHRDDKKYVTCIDALKEIQDGHINAIDYLVKVK